MPRKPRWISPNVQPNTATKRPAAATHRLNEAGRWLGSAVIILCGFFAAAYLAWLALSAVDFLYPWLYHALDIGEHIQRFGPENRYRDGFAATSEAKRLALFGQIVEAINDNGRGLEALSYRPGPDQAPVPLLRAPEIEHLRLVGHLVTTLEYGAWVASSLLVLTVGAMRLQGVEPTRMLRFGGIALGVAGAGALVFASFDVADAGWFARLHEWVFPPDHQWFFYYQDSLMTTLMKAPHLFGPIAAALGALTVVIYAALLALIRTLLTAHRSAAK